MDRAAVVAAGVEFVTRIWASLCKLGLVGFGALLAYWRNRAEQGEQVADGVEDWQRNDRRLRVRGDLERERLRKLSGKP